MNCLWYTPSGLLVVCIPSELFVVYTYVPSELFVVCTHVPPSELFVVYTYVPSVLFVLPMYLVSCLWYLCT